MLQRGFQILRMRLLVPIAGLTFLVHLPDTLSFWFVVSAVGLVPGFRETLELAGAPSLSTLMPAGVPTCGDAQVETGRSTGTRSRRTG
jgi:hypothetical protein